MTTGEGGMIISENHSLVERCRRLRLHGIDRDAYARSGLFSRQREYEVLEIGNKFNMTDIAAALGRTQLRRVDEGRGRRARIASRYQEAFSALPLVLPGQPDTDETHSWHLYPVQVLSEALRETLMNHLSEQGIGFSVHYRPLHRMTYWRERYRLSDSQFPVASTYATRCVSLPMT